MRFLLAGLAALLAADGFAGVRPATEGGFALGMPRAVALAIAGPEADIGAMCDGTQGVMRVRATGSAMASFAEGKVVRIETLASQPPGSPYATCSNAFDAQAAGLVRHWGEAAGAPNEAELGLARTRTVQFKRNDAQASLVLRWFPGGTCDTALRVEQSSL
jgi:hypothetical protein